MFLHRYPEQSLELVVPILSHFGERGGLVGIYSKTCSVLDEIMKKHPTEVWEQRQQTLGGPKTRSSRTIALEHWLRGGDLSDLAPMEDEGKEGTLTLIPREKIWKWIDEDMEERAWYFAYRPRP